MVLHVHKERVNNTSMIDVANEFLKRVPDSRKQIFGKFTKRDLSVKMSVAYKGKQVYVTKEQCNKERQSFALQFLRYLSLFGLTFLPD